MNLTCVGPASYADPRMRVKRGEVTKCAAEEALKYLYSPSLGNVFAEKPPFHAWFYRKNGHSRWVPRLERAGAREEGWKEVAQEELFTKATHVLLLRQMGLGDMLMLTPTIRALRRDCGKRVSLITLEKYLPLFDDNPWLDRAWGFDSYEEAGFDAGSYDFFGNLLWWVEFHPDNGQKPRIDLFAEGAGLSELTDHFLDYRVTDAERAWAQAAMADWPRPVTIIQGGSYALQRRLPQELITGIASGLPGTPLLLGEVDAAMPPNGRALANKTTLREAAALVEAADLVVAPDSGLAHVAGAVGTRCVVVISTIPYHLRYSYYPGHTWVDGTPVRGNCYCTDARHCKVYDREPPCLQAVTPGMVLEAAEVALAGGDH